MLVAAGCGSIHRPPDLDTAERAELTALRGRLASTTIRLVANSGKESETHHYVEALHSSGFEAAAFDPAHLGVGPVATIEDLSIGTRQDGFLTYLTMGLIPTIGGSDYAYRVDVARADGRLSTATCEESQSWVFGWLGLPLAALPGWETFTSPYGPQYLFRRPGDRLALCVARAVAAASLPK